VSCQDGRIGVGKPFGSTLIKRGRRDTRCHKGEKIENKKGEDEEIFQSTSGKVGSEGRQK